jgi:hypothetical protein
VDLKVGIIFLNDQRSEQFVICPSGGVKAEHPKLARRPAKPRMTVMPDTTGLLILDITDLILYVC